jgi:hypothetical protein
VSLAAEIANCLYADGMNLHPSWDEAMEVADTFLATPEMKAIREALKVVAIATAVPGDWFLPSQREVLQELDLLPSVIDWVLS